MEAEVEQVKDTQTPSPATPTQDREREQTSAIKKRGSVKRSDSYSPRLGVQRKGSLRRDQLTGEKRRSRTGSLHGYEAKYPVSTERESRTCSL